MSRNLCMTSCDECDGDEDDIVVTEKPRPITREEAGIYFAEFEGMHVANAHCNVCNTKYLAWFTRRSLRTGNGWAIGLPVEKEFIDLSYRSTFNDEPGKDDLDPAYQWERAKKKLSKAIYILEREAFRARIFDDSPIVVAAGERVRVKGEREIAELCEQLQKVLAVLSGPPLR